MAATTPAVLLAAALLWWGAPPATAADSPRPSVRLGELRGPVERPDGERRWRLPVDAFDPDGSIVALEIDWGDGTRLFVHFACLEPGTVLRSHLAHSYPAPGTYRVRVQATSVHDCEDPARPQLSPWEPAMVTAAPAPS